MTTTTDLPRIQRRLVAVLAAGQVLGGLGMGASLSTGALLVAFVSKDAAWSGMAATMLTLGAALTAIPLAALAARSGRRISLTTGAGVAVLGAVAIVGAAALGSLPMLLAAMLLLGAGTAAGLQARFAATDLAAERHRGRDLSLVVWSTTIGAVAGPNLLTPGGELAGLVGVPALAGPFLLTIASQVVAGLLYWIALRPDPLLHRRALDAAGAVPDALPASSPPPGVPAAASPPLPARLPLRARYAILSTAASHAVMVGVMAMTPVHLTEHGAGLTVVGVTISLHIAGMYALSPLFGILSDRWGRVSTILLGQGLLLAAVLTTALGTQDHTTVTVGLVLLGLGWSAATVAGSSLVTEAVAPAQAARVQGRADLAMNLAGAAAGALAGLALAAIGYDGLSLLAAVLVLAVIIGSALLGRRIAAARAS